MKDTIILMIFMFIILFVVSFCTGCSPKQVFGVNGNVENVEKPNTGKPVENVPIEENNDEKPVEPVSENNVEEAAENIDLSFVVNRIKDVKEAVYSIATKLKKQKSEVDISEDVQKIASSLSELEKEKVKLEEIELKANDESDDIKDLNNNVQKLNRNFYIFVSSFLVFYLISFIVLYWHLHKMKEKIWKK